MNFATTGIFSEAEFKQKQAAGDFPCDFTYSDYLTFKRLQREAAQRNRAQLNPEDRAILERMEARKQKRPLAA